jgi:hypothetical protein
MAAFAPLSPEYRPFLQSRLWEERNDMPLTMLSALARLDVDPWQEAAELAILPRDWAQKRLAALLRTLPGAPSVVLEVDALCGRSVNLLPVRAVAPGAPSAAVRSRTGLVAAASALLFLGTSLAAVYLVSTNAPPPSDRVTGSSSLSAASPAGGSARSH